MFQNASSNYLECGFSEWLIKPQGWGIIYPQLWIFLVPISVCAPGVFFYLLLVFWEAWPQSVKLSVPGGAEVVHLSLAWETFQCPGHCSYLFLHPCTWWKRGSGWRRIQYGTRLCPNALGPPFPVEQCRLTRTAFLLPELNVFLCFHGK